MLQDLAEILVLFIIAIGSVGVTLWHIISVQPPNPLSDAELEKEIAFRTRTKNPTMLDFSTRIADIFSHFGDHHVPSMDNEILDETMKKEILRLTEFCIAEFVESWYIPYVSSDNDLGNSMRSTIDHIVATIASRAKHVDWALFVSRHCTETLSDCFRILKDSVRELQSSDSSFASSSVESRLNAIWMTVATKYNLHQGANPIVGPELLEEYLRKLSTALLARTMPPREYQSGIVRSLLREIVSNKILSPSLELCDQKWVNKMMLIVLTPLIDDTESLRPILKNTTSPLSDSSMHSGGVATSSSTPPVSFEPTISSQLLTENSLQLKNRIDAWRAYQKGAALALRTGRTALSQSLMKMMLLLNPNALDPASMSLGGPVSTASLNMSSQHHNPPPVSMGQGTSGATFTSLNGSLAKSMDTSRSHYAQENNGNVTNTSSLPPRGPANHLNASSLHHTQFATMPHPSRSAPVPAPTFAATPSQPATSTMSSSSSRATGSALGSIPTALQRTTSQGFTQLPPTSRPLSAQKTSTPSLESKHDQAQDMHSISPILGTRSFSAMNSNSSASSISSVTPLSPLPAYTTDPELDAMVDDFFVNVAKGTKTSPDTSTKLNTDTNKRLMMDMEEKGETNLDITTVEGFAAADAHTHTTLTNSTSLDLCDDLTPNRMRSETESHVLVMSLPNASSFISSSSSSSFGVLIGNQIEPTSQAYDRHKTSSITETCDNRMVDKNQENHSQDTIPSSSFTPVVERMKSSSVVSTSTSEDEIRHMPTLSSLPSLSVAHVKPVGTLVDSMNSPSSTGSDGFSLPEGLLDSPNAIVNSIATLPRRDTVCFNSKEGLPVPAGLIDLSGGAVHPRMTIASPGTLNSDTLSLKAKDDTDMVHASDTRGNGNADRNSHDRSNETQYFETNMTSSAPSSAYGGETNPSSSTLSFSSTPALAPNATPLAQHQSSVGGITSSALKLAMEDAVYVLYHGHYYYDRMLQADWVACMEYLSETDAPINITISGARTQFNPKPYVLYELCMSAGPYRWSLQRRYSHFVELHNKLKRTFPSYQLSLPKKKIFGTFDQEFIQNRRVELQRFLRSMLINKKIVESRMFNFFFEPLIVLPTFSSEPGSTPTPSLTASGDATGMGHFRLDGNTTTGSIHSTKLPLSLSMSANGSNTPTILSNSSRQRPSSELFIAGGNDSFGNVSPELFSEADGSFTNHGTHENQKGMSLNQGLETLTRRPRADSISARYEEHDDLYNNLPDDLFMPYSTPTGASTTAGAGMSTSISDGSRNISSHTLNHFLFSGQNNSGSGKHTNHAANGFVEDESSGFSSSTPLTTSTALPTFGSSSSPYLPPSLPAASAVLEALMSKKESKDSRRLKKEEKDETMEKDNHDKSDKSEDAGQGSITSASSSSTSTSDGEKFRSFLKLNHISFHSVSGTPSTSNVGQNSTIDSAQIHVRALMNLVDEFFEFQDRSWARRQLVGIMKKVVNVAGANTYAKYIYQYTSPSTIAGGINWLIELLWPGGFAAPPSVEPTTAEEMANRSAVHILLQKVLNQYGGAVIGKQICNEAAFKLFTLLQMRPLLVHFILTVVDGLIFELFPEIEQEMKIQDDLTAKHPVFAQIRSTEIHSDNSGISKATIFSTERDDVTTSFMAPSSKIRNGTERNPSERGDNSAQLGGLQSFADDLVSSEIAVTQAFVTLDETAFGLNMVDVSSSAPTVVVSNSTSNASSIANHSASLTSTATTNAQTTSSSSNREGGVYISSKLLQS